MKIRQEVFEAIPNLRFLGMLQILDSNPLVTSKTQSRSGQASSSRQDVLSTVRSSWLWPLWLLQWTFLVFYIFWFSWATPLNHGVLNRGHPGVVNDISCVLGGIRGTLFSCWVKMGTAGNSSFLGSQEDKEATQHSVTSIIMVCLRTGVGTCTQTYFQKLIYFLIIGNVSNNFKKVTCQMSHYFGYQKTQNLHTLTSQPRCISSSYWSNSSFLEMDLVSLAHMRRQRIRHAGWHQKSSVNSWINVLGNNRISTADVVIRITLTKAVNYIVKAD